MNDKPTDPKKDALVQYIESEIKMLMATVAFIKKHGWYRCGFHAPDEAIFYVAVRENMLKAKQAELQKLTDNKIKIPS